MIREYKTVEEISGPLMMVRMVENVTYDELVEIELHDGSVRRGKVLDGTLGGLVQDADARKRGAAVVAPSLLARPRASVRHHASLRRDMDEGLVAVEDPCPRLAEIPRPQPRVRRLACAAGRREGVGAARILHDA